MTKRTLTTNPPVTESTYSLTKLTDRSGLQRIEEIKASRIGVNESGALLIMKQNPSTLRHEPVRIIAQGNWVEIQLACGAGT